MSVSVTMPRLGESVSEGTVTRWLKKEGERVEADEPLLEVSTDKVDTEIPAPASGVLSTIRVGEDETVEVGVELAVIDEGGSASGSAPAQEAPQQEAPPQEAPPQEAPQQEAPQRQEPAQAAAPEAPQQPAAAEPEPEPEPEPQQPAAREAPPEPPAQQQAPQQQPAQQPVDGQQAPQPSAQPAPAGGSGQRAVPAREDDESSGAYVTPLVRKLAAEHGVDLSSINGTGVGGRIRKQDVLEAARSRPAAPEPAQPVGSSDGGPVPVTSPVSPAPGPASPAAVEALPAPRVEPSPLRGTTEKMSRLRSVIARRMVESLQVSAQLTTVVEVDVTRVARLRQLAKADFQRREGVKLSFLPFFALATVEALKQHPGLNASIDAEAGTSTYHDAEHLGVAVDTERGLLVPVIHDAGDLNLGGMARKIADLAERTRANKVSPDELGGGTFTLTNTGSRGALFDTPIINQPQVGILGTGSVVKRPVVVDDPDLGEVIAVRSMVYLALTYDHRIVDGADAARFLVTVKERLEGGAFESELGLA
ncbi:MAG TPA: 2-oxoglutarate dehydrogenase, E2 component, dihydrolipoamide succinyltransferase [Mycobacteriales bacterium]|nr:2-oxoglutarate dehydrogenase, E2 component, dihydrolipoamide succinyltransferase [Mycobacteriales bacterium]